MSTLSEAQRQSLALAVHYALRCNCDSGLRDQIVADELSLAIEQLIADALAKKANEIAGRAVPKRADNTADQRLVGDAYRNAARIVRGAP